MTESSARKQDDRGASVRTVYYHDETVEVAGASPEAVLSRAGEWLTDQRQISPGWIVAGLDWHFAHDPAVGAVRYSLTMFMRRLDDDGRLEDGTRPTMVERQRSSLG